MTFESLCEFYEVAHTLNYSAAAEHLYLTETALSRHIKKLEEEIGGPLFYRSTRHITLTPLGELLLPYAEKSIELKKEMDQALAYHFHTEKTQLSISAINITNSYIDLTDLITKFNTQNPNISIDLITADRSVSDLLEQDSCELNFAPELPNHMDSKFDRILIKQDQIVAFIPQTHPLAHKETLALEDLKNERLILLTKGSPLFNLCIQACQDHGFTPNVVITMSNGDNIRSVVESGNGIGLLLEYPSMQQNTELTSSSVVQREFTDPLRVDFNLIYKPGLSSASLIFLSFTLSYLEQMNLS